ncbi:hypothetical protein Tco_1483244 [Tanacetum coccineum]
MFRISAAEAFQDQAKGKGKNDKEGEKQLEREKQFQNDFARVRPASNTSSKPGTCKGSAAGKENVRSLAMNRRMVSKTRKKKEKRDNSIMI